MKTSEESSQSSRTLRQCRVCRGEDLIPYLDLGNTPLANAFLREEDLNKVEFTEELYLQLCPSCGLSQLTKVVHPDRMFTNYLWVSSTTETFRRHLQALATQAKSTAAADELDLAVDIGSNDGYLLSQLQREGLRVVGVEPSNLSNSALYSGIPSLHRYWNEAAAKTIHRRFGPAKIVTSTNVLAHVDDVHGFAAAVELLLAPQGVWVIECPYVIDFLNQSAYDTTYHEHVSIFALTSLQRLLSEHGLEAFDVKYFAPIHGGAIRVYVSRMGGFPITPAVHEYFEREKKFGVVDPKPYQEMAQRVYSNRDKLRHMLDNMKREGKTVWAYGAAAKGNTQANFVGIKQELIPVIIDDNPRKHGWYTPGSHMRITGIDELKNSGVDFLLLLAWNFKDEIMERCQKVGFQGQFILPVPEPMVITYAKEGS